MAGEEHFTFRVYEVNKELSTLEDLVAAAAKYDYHIVTLITRM